MRLRPALLFCGLFSLNIFAVGDSTQTKTNIAVSDLAGQGIDASTAAVISDRLRSELFNTGMVSVLERSQMQEILKEQGFQQTGCTSDQCAVETGQLLGVKYMVVGSIGLVGHTYTIASRLIDVSTGKMAATANVDCKCEIDDILSQSTVKIASKLVQYFSPVQNNEPPKPAVTEKPIESVEDKTNIPKTLPVPSSQVGNEKKHSPAWPKITLGTGTIVAAGAGYLLDVLAKNEINKCTDIAAQYANSGSNSGYATYHQDYIGHYNNAKSYTSYRNILYGAAGVLTAGFVISFLF